MDVCSLLWWALLVIIVIQIVRLVRADGDLQLLWLEKFGKKPECLQGKVVWITGASSGIGEHLAYKLADAGCRLILSARREQELQRVSNKCLASSKLNTGDILVLPMDVLQFHAHEQKFQEILRTFGHVDILVNNAGRTQRGEVVDTEFEIERQIMELDYFAVLSLTKTVLTHMIERHTGHIVVTSSGAGKFGLPFSAGYCGVKHALQGWFDSLRVELSGSGIDVTLVCPGPVFSGVQKAAFSTKVGEEYGIDMDPSDNRMRTSRCAELMVVAMANRPYEVWISKHPILLAYYAFQYVPGIAKWASAKFGSKGVTALRHGKGLTTNTKQD